METNAKDEKLNKTLKKIKILDRMRIFSLLFSLLFVLFIFYGNKFASEMNWYLQSRVIIYNLLFFIVLIMLIVTFLKLYFVAKYNNLIKNTN